MLTVFILIGSAIGLAVAGYITYELFWGIEWTDL